MRMITPSMKELASTRYALMQRGFMNQSDIAKFVPCGKAKAKKILISIRADTKSQGIDNLDGNMILTSRLIKYLGLTEAQITRAYEKALTDQS